MIKLFESKKTTEEKLIAKAERLILDQLSDRYSITIGCIPAPATEYAKKVINDQIDKIEIKERIDSFLDSELLEEVVAKHVSVNLERLLKDNLIEGIVDKINKLQLKSENP